MQTINKSIGCGPHDVEYSELLTLHDDHLRIKISSYDIKHQSSATIYIWDGVWVSVFSIHPAAMETEHNLIMRNVAAGTMFRLEQTDLKTYGIEFFDADRERLLTMAAQILTPMATQILTPAEPEGAPFNPAEMQRICNYINGWTSEKKLNPQSLQRALDLRGTTAEPEPSPDHFWISNNTDTTYGIQAPAIDPAAAGRGLFLCEWTAVSETDYNATVCDKWFYDGHWHEGEGK